MLVAGTARSLLGALPWYYAGYYFHRERLERFASRHGRRLTMTPQDVQTASDWFERYGASAVFFGRLIPTVRTVISVPAGINRMGLPRLPGAVGAGNGNAGPRFLAFAGSILQSQYDRVAGWLDPATWLVIGVIVVVLHLSGGDLRPAPQQAGREECGEANAPGR